MGKRLTIQEFINKANKVHNNIYGYEKSIYINSITPIIILCKKHGEFLQKPNYHLSGNGCSKCGYDKIISTHVCNTEKFISKATKKHGNKYDYSKVNYDGYKNLITIICPKHGLFKQSPHDHLRTIGCKKCGYETTGNKLRFTLNEFINKSNSVHENKYNYDFVQYEDSFKKVKIKCLKHGIFEQTPVMHMQGQGCPYCVNSSGERKISIILNNYNIKFEIEKKFDECKNIRKLPFDFYLSDFNICIEFQGIQHYDAYHHMGGISAFQKLIKNDEIKKKFCQERNIKLIEIKHDDNIEDKLRKFNII